ncbi:unnamed protein product [Rhodiola kirilowii]
MLTNLMSVFLEGSLLCEDLLSGIRHSLSSSPLQISTFFRPIEKSAISVNPISMYKCFQIENSIHG